jgi:hypothetical protein
LNVNPPVFSLEMRRALRPRTSANRAARAEVISPTALFEIHWELVKLRNKMLSKREYWTVVVPRGFSVWNGCR